VSSQTLLPLRFKGACGVSFPAGGGVGEVLIAYCPESPIHPNERIKMENGQNAYEFNVAAGFVKRVGRTAPSHDLTPDNVALVFPTEDEQKSTIGFGLRYNSTPLEGVHMTGAMLTSKNSLASVQEHADAFAYIGATVKPIGYTFFGPNTVIPLKFNRAEEMSRFMQLNAVGTPEGQTNDRNWHISVPLKRGVDGKWVKRFDDVSDEKFAMWKDVLNNVPSLEGMSDLELNALIYSNV
jgi:hypothetical protein